MKKLITVLVLGISLFAACDLFVDKAAVRKGLVTAMDKVLTTEENFYNEYWALVDGSDTAPFLQAVDDFDAATTKLDEYVSSTRFHSTQQALTDAYKDSYKPFIDGYIEDVHSFANKMKDEGFVYEEFEPLFPGIDQHTIDFVNIHNELSDIVNVEAEAETETKETDK